MAQEYKSQKGPVIEHLYDTIYLGEGRSIITLTDIRSAIGHCNDVYGLDLSQNNPANFMKDIVRTKSGAEHWPQRLKDKRIGGRQRVGGGRALEFVPYRDDQTDPFQNTWERSGDLEPIPVQSLSLPLTAKSLGRTDESWLVQVAVGLRVVETHFSIRERDKPLDVLEVTHLQTGVKLSSSEVDALFLATIKGPDNISIHALVTCEAKQANERILDHQIVEQVVAANKSVKSLGLDIGLIIPIAIHAERDPAGCVYVAEFEEWTPEQAEVAEEDLATLVLAAEGLYQLHPPVAGVGFKRPAIKRAKKPKA